MVYISLNASTRVDITLVCTHVRFFFEACSSNVSKTFFQKATKHYYQKVQREKKSPLLKSLKVPFFPLLLKSLLESILHQMQLLEESHYDPTWWKNGGCSAGLHGGLYTQLNRNEHGLLCSRKSDHCPSTQEAAVDFLNLHSSKITSSCSLPLRSAN